MARTPTTTAPDAHAAEVEQQAQIESQVTTDPTPPVDPPPVVEEPTPDVPPEVEAEQEATATIKSVNVEAYPIHVDVVGAPDGGYTFTDADTTFDVPLAVAEQFTYVSQVEVVA